jgi:hypothetical protein
MADRSEHAHPSNTGSDGAPVSVTAPALTPNHLHVVAGQLLRPGKAPFSWRSLQSIDPGMTAFCGDQFSLDNVFLDIGGLDRYREET